MAQAIRDEIIEELAQGYSSPTDLLGEEGLFKELKKRLLERALGAELSEHLGYEKGDPAGRGSGNSRSGYSNKTVIGDDGAIEIAVPRDRNSSFEHDPAPSFEPLFPRRLPRHSREPRCVMLSPNLSYASSRRQTCQPISSAKSRSPTQPGSSPIERRPQ